MACLALFRPGSHHAGSTKYYCHFISSKFEITIVLIGFTDSFKVRLFLDLVLILIVQMSCNDTIEFVFVIEPFPPNFVQVVYLQMGVSNSE